MEQRLAAGLVARRAADLPRPVVPRRPPRRAHEHLRRLRRRDEDNLRELPSVLAVPLRRARRRGGEHEGAVFNVKGEDLLFLDQPNAGLDDDEPRPRTRQLGLPAGPFESVGIWAPVRRAPTCRRPIPAAAGGVRAYFWTVRDVVRESAPPLHVRRGGRRAQPDRGPRTRVEAALQREAEDDPDSPATVRLPDEVGDARCTSSRSTQLCELIDDGSPRMARRWAATAAPGTVAAFLRRLDGARLPLRPSDPRRRCRRARAAPDRLGVDQVSVIDIHNLHDRAKRFVVGVVVKRLFEQKETTGSAAARLPRPRRAQQVRPARGLVADQGGAARHRRARPQPRDHPDRRPADGERGRAADRRERGDSRRRSARPGGGAASRVRLPHRRRARQRARSSSPGTMLLQQPHMPMPLEVTFPFPAWATRRRARRRRRRGARRPIRRGSSDEDPAHRRLARRQDDSRVDHGSRRRAAVLDEVVAIAGRGTRSTSCSSAVTSSSTLAIAGSRAGRLRRAARVRRRGSRSSSSRATTTTRSAGARSSRCSRRFAVHVVPEVRRPERGRHRRDPGRDGSTVAQIAALPWVTERRLIGAAELMGLAEQPYQTYATEVARLIEALCAAFDRRSATCSLLTCTSPARSLPGASVR